VSDELLEHEGEPSDMEAMRSAATLIAWASAKATWSTSFAGLFGGAAAVGLGLLNRGEAWAGAPVASGVGLLVTGAMSFGACIGRSLDRRRSPRTRRTVREGPTSNVPKTSTRAR
jgi:hypothetical protein